MSWNCGAEGRTSDPKILAIRERQERNFMAMLLMSLGVPMIRAGDERGNSQNGNNNAYCQDNETSWLSWELDESQQRLLEFVRQMMQFRAKQPTLHRRKFFQGRPIRGLGIKDVSWFDVSGDQMTDQAWQCECHTLGVRFAGDLVDDVDEEGNRIVGNTRLMLLKAGPEIASFVLPEACGPNGWELVLDTRRDNDFGINDLQERVHQPDQGTYQMKAHSLAVFRTPAG